MSVPRLLRIEYPGAIYHVMSRGDRREPLFKDDRDRQRFLATLDEAAAKTEWQVHAYRLMRFPLAPNSVGCSRMPACSGGMLDTGSNSPQIVCVRLIAPGTLRIWADQFPDAAEALSRWQTVIGSCSFEHFPALRRTFPSADQVTVKSGRTVTVFNLRGRNYRLIAAIHYRGQRCYALRFVTHSECDEGRWSTEL